MDGIEPFNQERNLARVASGMRGGPFDKKLNLAPSMNFVDGVDPLSTKKLMAGPFPQPTPTDPWVVRYPNAKMK